MNPIILHMNVDVVSIIKNLKLKQLHVMRQFTTFSPSEWMRLVDTTNPRWNQATKETNLWVSLI